MVLRKFQNSEENTCTRASFLIKLEDGLETPAQVFFCQFLEIFKNSYVLLNLHKDLLKSS